ncbi:MAG TPA: hypothetical protein VFL86_15620 [Burkholderiaceae bacterium]|nr:hypothetical protein [Burkholderiaceae bacterium]
MKLHQLLSVPVVALACQVAVAQPNPAAPPCFAASAASAPGRGCGGPMGPMGRHRWDAAATPGWSMMTPEERWAHHEKMAGFKQYDECTAYMTQHRQLMLDRAKQRGLTAPPGPGRDACAPLKSGPKP